MSVSEISGSSFGTFSAAELEFIAENLSIDILPAAKMSVLHCIAGDYGPFRPQVKASVPLWLAITLKKGKHCRIIPPLWMDVEFLQQRLEAEQKNVGEYQPIPFNYLEISILLLESAVDDISRSEDIRRLIQAIREVRHRKTAVGLGLLDGAPLKLNNLGVFELNEVRSALCSSMDRLVELRNSAAEELANSRTAHRDTLSSTYDTYSPIY